MGLLESDPLPTPAEVAHREISNRVRAAFTQLQGALAAGQNLLWANPDATPKDVLAEFGTEAVQLFQLSNIAVEAINAVASITGGPQIGSIVPPDVHYTLHADGTITLTNAPTE
jgi:hypothetical protein